MTSGLTEVSRIPFSYLRKQWDGGDWSSSAKPSGLTSYWARVDKAISDASSPGFVKKTGFKKLPKRAVQEYHGYLMDRIDWFSPQDARWDNYADLAHTIYLSTTDMPFYTMYGVGYSSFFESTWTTNDDIALIGKLREKIVGSDFDMGVFLGEGREALSLIADTAVRSRQFLTALRRLDANGIAKSLGINKSRAAKVVKGVPRRGDVSVALAEANLSLQYGWLPLLKDAEGAAQALAQQLNFPATQTYKARLRRPIPWTIVSPNLRSFAYEGTVRGQLIAKITEKNVPGLLGLIDPSTVLWELTPWSFVADWFIPIGSYLQARGVSQFTSGTYIKTLYSSERFACNGGAPVNPYTNITQECVMRASRVRVNRTVGSSLDVPLPSFKNLSDVPSWRRAANAVSLLVTGFAGSRRS
jgi:hypothetical protein